MPRAFRENFPRRGFNTNILRVDFLEEQSFPYKIMYLALSTFRHYAEISFLNNL